MTPLRRRPRRRRAASASRARPKSRSRSSRRAARVDDRAVRRRVHRRRPFDSRKLARSRSARRPGSSSTPATGRSTRRRWSARRPTRRACARSATRACSRCLRFDQRAARGREPVGGRRRATLAELVGKAKGRVVVTTFASNVARLRAAAEAGLRQRPAGLVIGRAMERVVAVARECGYLDGLPPFLGPDAFDRLPRDKVLALATGSQGEPRAALARIAEDEHPARELAPGDTVDLLLAHHPRQREGGRQDRQRPRHPGHRVDHRPHAARPCLRPSAPRRTRADVRLAEAEDRRARAWRGRCIWPSMPPSPRRRACQRGACARFNGDIVPLAAGEARDRRPGRPRPASTRTATSCSPADDDCVGERRKLSFAGVVSIAIALTPKGDMAGDPDVMIAGLPEAHPRRRGLRRAHRRGDLRDLREPAARQAARRRCGLQRDRAGGARSVNAAWGKKPRCMCWSWRFKGSSEQRWRIGCATAPTPSLAIRRCSGVTP